MTAAENSGKTLTTGDYLNLFGGLAAGASMLTPPSPDRPSVTLTTVEPRNPDLEELERKPSGLTEDSFRAGKTFEYGEGVVSATVTADLVAFNKCLDRWGTWLTPPEGAQVETPPETAALEICKRGFSVTPPEPKK